MWLICDDFVSNEQYTGDYNVISLSSPKPKAFNQFIKGRGVTLLYLHTWSYEELAAVQAKLGVPAEVGEMSPDLQGCSQLVACVLRLQQLLLPMDACRRYGVLHLRLQPPPPRHMTRDS